MLQKYIGKDNSRYISLELPEKMFREKKFIWHLVFLVKN